MTRGLFVLLLAGLAFAQDDSGITEDGVPAGETGKPARTEPYPARAPGRKPSMVVIKKKVYSLALPADWVLQEFEDSKAELSWDVLLPGSTNRASLSLVRGDGGDPRSTPYYQAEWVKKEQADRRTEVRTKPCPRLVVHRSIKATEWTDAFFCLSVRNNPYVLQVSCAAADFEQAEADLLNSVRSFSAKVELWPPIPKGYEVSPEGTWLVARAPNVTTSLGPLVKTLKETEKRFRRDHGPLPKSDAPIVILVHASKADAGTIEPKAGESPQGFYTDTTHRRMFAIPVPAGNADLASIAASSAHGLLLVAKYGDGRPDWVYAGECGVAQAESYTGKPLPALDEGFVAWTSTLKLHRLDELAALYASDQDTWHKECLFYVAALREGKYAKAYRAFLDDYAATADGLGAFERCLASIDQEDLRTSTNQFISTRIKPEKRGK